jgi:hypothetical protein
MANYTLSTALRSNDQQDLTMIRLGNPMVADTKKLLSITPHATPLTLENTALKQLMRDTNNSRRTNKAILTIATGDVDYAGM